MKYLLLILPIFILNSCGDPKPCPEKKCLYPRLPTYKVPESRPIKVRPLDANNSVIKNKDLLELVRNNTKLRKICSNYAIINKRVNKEYNDESSNSSRP